MMTFDVNQYPEVVRTILGNGQRLMSLGPGEPLPAMQAILKPLEVDALFEEPIRDRMAARACLSGLWLYHNFLEESHEISQEIPSAEGSFWHAIMHRREPDPSNSKYWWRKVGSHPAIAILRQQAEPLGYRYTIPEDFVDLCECVRGANNAQEALAQRVQLLEWHVLYAYCHRLALE